MSEKTSKKILLGVITGVHGIKGEVKLQSFTANPEAIAGYGPLDTSNGQTLTIKSLKPHKQAFRARIDDIEDRNQAEALRGVELSIARDRLPAPEEDEVYHADLIGLAILDEKGNSLGTVENILDFGAGEILEYRPKGAKSTELVAFNMDTVPTIDLDAGTLILIPPEEVSTDEKDMD